MRARRRNEQGVASTTARSRGAAARWAAPPPVAARPRRRSRPSASPNRTLAVELDSDAAQRGVVAVGLASLFHPAYAVLEVREPGAAQELSDLLGAALRDRRVLDERRAVGQQHAAAITRNRDAARAPRFGRLEDRR